VSNTNPTALGQEVLPPVHLQHLAQQANEAHAATGHAIGEAVQYALAAGRALRTAREQIKPGLWAHWVQRNCTFSLRHAQRYIRLFEAYEADATPVSRDILGLSLRGAMKRLTPPVHRQVSTRRKAAAPCVDGGLGLAQAFLNAAPHERVRAIQNIGLKPLFEALPEDWLPFVERWMTGRKAALIAPPSVPLLQIGADGFPDLPACLRRASATPTH
jgi:hypothetical protein